MSDLIFGKDKTERVVGVEPGERHQCVLFIQEGNGDIAKRVVPMSHWLIYSKQHSSKMTELAGDQPYKWLMEYDNKKKFNEILKTSRQKRYDLYQCYDPKEAFMLRSGVTYFKGMKVKDVSVLSFDLEHTYGIGEVPNKDGKLLLISNTYRDSNGKITKKLFAYDDFYDEQAMLYGWIKFIQEVDPSIVIGHNVFGHDFKILRHAARKHSVKLKLGRDGSDLRVDTRTSYKRKDMSQSYEFFNVHIYGREIIDTFFLAINFDVARNYESYGLKQIIKQEGLEKNHRTFYDASQILKNYLIPEEWEKIKEYCIDDSDDALSLYDLMIPSFFYATRSIPRSLQHVNNSASGGQVNAVMVRGYLQQGHSIARACPKRKFPGAISFGVPGIHRNVLRFDVASLYPNIILQYGICNREKDPQELFLKMVRYFTEERLKYKKIGRETGDRFYKDLEQAQKIFINSAYGFLGAGKLNYNYFDGADSVTAHGRRILKTAVLWATGQEYEGKDVGEEEENADA
jgi:DNA polymerase I